LTVPERRGVSGADLLLAKRSPGDVTVQPRSRGAGFVGRAGPAGPMHYQIWTALFQAKIRATALGGNWGDPKGDDLGNLGKDG
jgi:hypothetical protein